MKPGLAARAAASAAARARAAGPTRAPRAAASRMQVQASDVHHARRAGPAREAQGVLRAFFEDIFPFNFVSGTATRSLDLICPLLCVGGLAAQIAPQTSIENFLPDNHPFQRYQDVESNFQASTTPRRSNEFVWGFEAQDPLDQTGATSSSTRTSRASPITTRLPPRPSQPAGAHRGVRHPRGVQLHKVEVDTDTGGPGSRGPASSRPSRPTASSTTCPSPCRRRGRRRHPRLARGLRNRWGCLVGDRHSELAYGGDLGFVGLPVGTRGIKIVWCKSERHRRQREGLPAGDAAARHLQ